MDLPPVTLEHGERYGKLMVLRKTPSGEYLVGRSVRPIYHRGAGSEEIVSTA